MQDIHFDGLAQTFHDTVYESSQGFIRLGVLWEDLRESVPQMNYGPRQASGYRLKLSCQTGWAVADAAACTLPHPDA